MVNINSTLKYILIFIVIITFIHFICSFLQVCNFSIFQKLQYWYINRCNSKNKIFEKLLLLNSKIYESLVYIIIIIDPIKKVLDFNMNSFSSKLLSNGTKRTFKAIFNYGIIYGIVLAIYINYKNIPKYIQSGMAHINLKAIKTIIDFSINNKSIILFILGIIAVIYNICENKYINKPIENIQDNELKKIIEQHQKICLKLVELNKSLQKNIERILLLSKKKGIYTFLYKVVADEFDFCQYSESQNKLIINDDENNKKETPFYNYDNNFAKKFENINSELGNLQSIFIEYEKCNSFYSLYEIKKYYKKLNIFDIEYLAKYERNLIDKTFINNMIERIIDGIDLLPIDCEKDKTLIINKLNARIKNENELLHYAITQSIDENIKINKYIGILKKETKLKKHRRKSPFDDILSAIK